MGIPHNIESIYNLPNLTSMSFLDAREHGSKQGSGFLSKYQENLDRRERLRRLALETIDLEKDPYFMKNHLGQYECRLCLTLHSNEGSYLAHTQGKRHQQSMASRASRMNFEIKTRPDSSRHVITKKGIFIGRPGYSVTKQYDTEANQRSLLFQINYREIDKDSDPRHRFMSSYEQHQERADKRYQYVIFRAEPYETIGFRIPSYEINLGTSTSDGSLQNKTTIDSSSYDELYFSHWDPDLKIYTLQIALSNTS